MKMLGASSRVRMTLSCQALEIWVWGLSVCVCVCVCACVLGQAGDLGCEDVCFSGDFPTACLHFKKGNKSNISHPPGL